MPLGIALKIVLLANDVALGTVPGLCFLSVTLQYLPCWILLLAREFILATLMAPRHDHHFWYTSLSLSSQQHISLESWPQTLD